MGPTVWRRRRPEQWGWEPEEEAEGGAGGGGVLLVDRELVEEEMRVADGRWRI